MQRIGVFVCHCGSNIAATVDVKKVVEVISKEPSVVHAEDYQYMCSEAGQEKMAAAIREKNLTGVVVCSCSPRFRYLPLYQIISNANPTDPFSADRSVFLFPIPVFRKNCAAGLTKNKKYYIIIMNFYFFMRAARRKDELLWRKKFPKFSVLWYLTMMSCAKGFPRKSTNH